MKAFARLVFAIALLFFAAPLRADGPQYQVFDLGTLGGSISAGYAINDSGQITGYSNIEGDDAHHAFFFDGTMIDLGTLGGTSSEGSAINAAGQVVGESDTVGDNAVHAFLSSGKSMIDLGTFSGTNSAYDSHANAINDSGIVVGDSHLVSPDNRSHAFAYLSGKMTDVGTLGGKLSTARGINASGQITGESDISTNSGVYHAFLYSDGTMTDLGALGLNSQGNAINSAGQVAGDVEVNIRGVAADWHAFLYANGTMTDLGTLGGNQSFGNGINDSGQITGYSLLSTNAGQRRAFLFTGGTMYDLNALAQENMGGFDVLNYGGGINNQGWITGYGTVHGSGQIHAFLAKPLGPSLSIRVASGKAVISWESAGFIVQSSSNLGAGADWQPFGPPPTLSNGEYSVPVNATEHAHFFRLFKP